MKKHMGITILEVVVSVAIIGILLGLTINPMQTWMRDMRIRNMADSFQNGIRLAQMEALKTNGTATFWLVSDLTNACTLSDSGRAWIVSTATTSPANNCTASYLQKNDMSARGSAEVNVAATDSSDAAASCISFNGMGRVTSTCINGDNPIEKLVNSGTTGTRTLEIRISIGGSIRMCDPDTNLATGDPRKCE